MENLDKNRKVIILKECGFDKYKEIKELSFEDQVFKYYTGKVPTNIHKAMIVEDDDKIYLGYYQYVVKMGKSHLYLQKMAYSGFTYTKSGKATSRVKVWQGKTLFDMLYLEEFVKHIGQEWWNKLGNLGKQLLTPGLLGMIIKGTITNPRDYCKYYIKNCLRLDVSPELLFKCLKRVPKEVKLNHYRTQIKEISILDEVFNHKNTFSKILALSINPNEFLIRLSDDDFRVWFGNSIGGAGEGDVGDMIYQACALSKKIDFSWSPRRMKEVHQEWTQIMTEKELGYVPDLNYDYKGDLNLPKGWRLIGTEKELFAEGQTMHHCIYGRREQLRNRVCFVLNAEIGDESITVLVSKDGKGKKWCAKEQQTRYNHQVEGHRKEWIKEVIERPLNQKFFSDNGNKSQAEKKDVIYDDVPVF